MQSNNRRHRTPQKLKESRRSRRSAPSSCSSERGRRPWAGRVEHVTSGRVARFQSAEELWAFMTQVVGEGAEQSPEEESSDRES